MNFWIIHAQEPLPQPDVPNQRLWRSNTIAEMLARRGHQVVRWRSSFSHYEKRYLVMGSPRQELAGCTYQFIDGPAYNSNVEFRRIRHHEVLARRFAELARNDHARPELIHVSNVPIELCREAVRFAVEQGIPAIVDVRDLWPDLFLDLVPAPVSFLRPAVKLLLRSSYRNAAYAMRHATAVTGITQPFVNWGLALADRPATALDRVFHMSYPELTATDDDTRIHALLQRLGLSPDDCICCYFGAIGYQSDFDTLIETSRRLAGKSRIKLVVCGDGPKLRGLRAKAADVPGILFPGWLEAEDVQALMRVATVGLIPFKESDNYVLNMPNKFSEYLAGGLVIACGIRGEMAKLVAAHDCGFVYPTGDARSLARSLIELTADPARVAVMKANARALFRDRFDCKVVYAELCDYLEEMARSGAAWRSWTGGGAPAS
jgi:glycosyltransferase involved in cell wall biosynthesis